MLPRGLYVITRPATDPARLLAEVGAALRGGAVLVQYRDKGRDPARRQHEAGALVELCRGHGVPLIVNDDPGLARAVGADGVHLGETDADLAETRAFLGPTAIIGVSCYNRLGRARQAAAAGADYLAFGRFFPSGSKPQAVQAHPDLLREARALGRPLAAIGGINADNGAELVAAGADLLAVIEAVLGAAEEVRPAAQIESAAAAIAALYHDPAAARARGA